MNDETVVERELGTPAETYTIMRGEIKHEDDLIGQRVNWFTASQAFLLVSFAIAQQEKTAMPTAANNYFFPLVPLVALASCVVILFGVIAGLAALRQWRAKLCALISRNPEMPRLVNDGWIVAMAWTAPLVLPVVFIIAWTYLLYYGLR
jgi:hypothetical protein